LNAMRFFPLEAPGADPFRAELGRCLQTAQMPEQAPMQFKETGSSGDRKREIRYPLRTMGFRTTLYLSEIGHPRLSAAINCTPSRPRSEVLEKASPGCADG